jgi:hypothetical protein
MKYASFGSVSTGTLRTEDLLSAFASELDYQLKRQPKSFKRGAMRKLINEANRIDPDSDDASDLVNELQDALSEFAPPYGYFGTLEGDGADFGFWLSSDVVRNFRDDGGLVVDDLSELPRGVRGEVMQVSDHGNVTLYVVGSRGKVREVWGVV